MLRAHYYYNFKRASSSYSRTLNKLLYTSCVFVGIKPVASCMFRTRCLPKFFVTWLSLVQRIDHARGHKLVGRAMNKQHGFGAMAHLIEG